MPGKTCFNGVSWQVRAAYLLFTLLEECLTSWEVSEWVHGVVKEIPMELMVNWPSELSTVWGGMLLSQTMHYGAL